MRKVAALIAVLVAASVAYTYWPTAEQSTAIPAQSGAPGAAIVDVMVPETLSQNAQIGQKAFEGNCAACHGINAVGQDGVAPPLVHKIYEPSHHGDESFQRAAAQGVQAHHWRFGNMPAVEGITRGEVTLIIAYIRELQRANGIN
ncbi:c-type cytochrome [Sulfitobacter sp.]|uniref:c-type cytochrome n=1 Tax=Sulfitobacter sp. TaxID=1903071 RepID=UPI00300246E2